MPMIFGCITLIDWFVPIFLENGYAPVGNCNKNIKLYVCYIISFGRLFGTMLIAINKQNQYTIVTIITAVLNSSSKYDIYKVFSFGPIGVAFASVISPEVVATTIQLWDVERICSYKNNFKIYD